MKKYRVNVNGTAYEVEIEEMNGAPAAAPVAAAPAAPMKFLAGSSSGRMRKMAHFSAANISALMGLS